MEQVAKDVPQPGSPNKTTQQKDCSGWFGSLLLCFPLQFSIELFPWLSKVVLATFHVTQFSDYTFNQETFGDVKLGVLVNSSYLP